MTQTFTYQASVLNVHDGDTVDMLVVLEAGRDLGFAITTHDTTMALSLRFLGYDAPELATPNGKLAQAALADLVAKHPGPYTTMSAHWDKYAGRYDGTLVANDGTDLVAAMVALGWLRPYSGNGPKPWSPQGT